MNNVNVFFIQQSFFISQIVINFTNHSENYYESMEESSQGMRWYKKTYKTYMKAFRENEENVK